MSGRKSGTIIAKGEGRWLLRWYVGRTPAGKRQYASKMFEGTIRQAQQELARQTVSVSDGGFVMPTKQTLGEYLEWWLDNVAVNKVTPATLKSYRRQLGLYITAKLGHLKLDKVTWQAIQQVYNELRGSNLSPRSIQYAHTVLKMALRHAVKGRILKENPCDHVEPPAKSHNEMEVWNADEVQLFLERTQGTRDHAMWHVLLNTGLRPGELFGLKWGDLQGDRLHIQRAIAETAQKGVYTEEAPKTERSKRAISLSQATVDVLQAHRRRQAQEIIAAGPAYERNDFIFADAYGHHLTIIPVRGRWKTAVRRAGLKELRLYDTRHTHATLLLKAGVNPKVVSERLGHASVVITLDTYSHVLPDMQDEAVNRLDALFASRVNANQ